MNVFAQWLHDNSITPYEMAKLTGCDRASIYAYIEGAIPQLENAVRISLATDDEIPVISWLKGKELTYEVTSISSHRYQQMREAEMQSAL